MALGLPHPDAAVQAAVAVELLHMSSLIHDDLMDNSPQRRGVASIHVTAGAPTAIAMGNLLLARGTSVAAGLGSACARVYTEALQALWEGQLMELTAVCAESRSSHLQYIALKTGALMSATAQIAALSQNVDEQRAADLARFGNGVGMAFQIADDLLDHIGDAEALGKPVGGDAGRGIVSVGAWFGLADKGLTSRNVEPGQLNSLAGGDIEVKHAIDTMHGYLDLAASALADAGVSDDAVWRDARRQIQRMLIGGCRADRRCLVEHLVAS